MLSALSDYNNSRSNSLDETKGRWRLFSLCLLSLHEPERDERFLNFLVAVLASTTSEEALKVILLDEKKRSYSPYGQPKPYDLDLNKILQLLD